MDGDAYPMRMNIGTYHEKEAMFYLRTVTSPCCHSALLVMHYGLHACSGAISSHPELSNLRPCAPIDLLQLFKIVTKTFSSLSGESNDLVNASSPGGFNIVNREEALLYYNRLTSVRIRTVIESFITNVLNTEEVGGTHFDLLFCCRLIAGCINSDKTLDKILCGEIAREENRSLEDFDAWLEGW